MESITEAEERRTGHRKRFSGKKGKLDGVMGVLSVYSPCAALWVTLSCLMMNQVLRKYSYMKDYFIIDSRFCVSLINWIIVWSIKCQKTMTKCRSSQENLELPDLQWCKTEKSSKFFGNMLDKWLKGNVYPIIKNLVIIYSPPCRWTVRWSGASH